MNEGAEITPNQFQNSRGPEKMKRLLADTPVIQNRLTAQGDAAASPRRGSALREPPHAVNTLQKCGVCKLEFKLRIAKARRLFGLLRSVMSRVFPKHLERGLPQQSSGTRTACARLQFDHHSDERCIERKGLGSRFQTRQQIFRSALELRAGGSKPCWDSKPLNSTLCFVFPPVSCFY